MINKLENGTVAVGSPGSEAREESELLDRLRGLEDDYDVLFRFLIAYCALPNGSTKPDLGITATEAYIHSMTQGTKFLKPRLERFIAFGQQFLDRKENP